MTPAYMPFTHLSESTAGMLSSLVGPVVVYQPLKKRVPEYLSALASQGFIDIRTPITHDDDRMCAALAEFTEWARMNPGASTQGTGFFSARQGEVPFFDENSISQIRSDIKGYHSTAPPTNASEAAFSTRLFLAVAQENDLAADRLDHDLKRFKSLEKDFLATMKDAGDATFNRETNSATIWREDPGAKMTGQRIRAWANLAAADTDLPELLVTTSASVMDNLLESHGESINLDKMACIRLAVPTESTSPVLGRVLADLVTSPSADLAPFMALAADVASEPVVTVTLFGAVNQTPTTVFSRMISSAATLPEDKNRAESICHTLFVLVEG